MKLTIEQLEKLSSQRRRGSHGGLREEIAALCEGSASNYLAFLKCTRYEMWLVALKGG